MTDSPPAAGRPVPDLPFSDLKVVDLSQGVAGPYVGQLLRLWGARVVKIEPPGGDWVRHLGKVYPGGHSAFSINYNRGKRSLALDVREPAGRGIVERLVREADVFVESNRPGVAARLGLGWPQLSALNPGLVYLSVSGFGQSGPYAERPLTDTVAQAYAGLMAINKGADGQPHRVGMFVADAVTGLYAFQAVVAALWQRRLKGTGGRHIDAALTQGLAALLSPKIGEAYLQGGPAPPFNVPAGSYRTADGWIAVTLVTEAQFVAICRAVGRPELAADPRFDSFARRKENEAALLAILNGLIAARPSAEWLARFRAEDALADRINAPQEWLVEPHVQATGGATYVEHPGIGRVPFVNLPGLAAPPADAPDWLAPAIGEHSAEVLAELGLGAAEIGALAAAGTVKLGERPA